MLTIYDILDNKKKRDFKKQEMFKTILENCCKKIKKCDEIRVAYCVFDVPEYMFGYPLYNLNECIVYMLTELTKGGFQVQYLFPCTLIISWFTQSTKSAIEHKSNDVVQKGKKSTVKKNGKFVLSLS